MTFNHHRKRDLSLLIANILDHFDTALYSFLAPLLGAIFFPPADPVVQLIMAYSLLATSLFTRPFGTYLFGTLACKWGPERSLSYSLLGASVLTFLIGCLPSYDAIGWLAPAILIFIRLGRGLCAAGESTIAKLYILENKNTVQAFTASYWYNASTMGGIILASAVSTVCFFI